MTARPTLPILGEPEDTPRIRRSPPWLALGFRPFFLAAALHALVFVPWWLHKVQSGALAGRGSSLLPMWWHGHEMIFGFTLAVVAGFLLTAVRNWTGRETAHGSLLAALLALWIAGRGAMAAVDFLPAWLVGATVVAFPLALAVVIGRPLIATRSRRNYGLLALLTALAGACALVHWGAAQAQPLITQRGLHLAVHLFVLLNVVIGGRVIPLFTRTATRHDSVRHVPAADWLAIAATAALLLAVSLGATGALLTGSAALAGAANLLRMRTWGTRMSLRRPMVLVLHLGYAWIGLGQLLVAAAAAGGPIPGSTALHALTIGVIGTMTLGMMARVTLGHSGLEVRSSRLTNLAFTLMGLAALARLASVLLPAQFWLGTVLVSGGAFTLAFALFLARYGRILAGAGTIMPYFLKS